MLLRLTVSARVDLPPPINDQKVGPQVVKDGTERSKKAVVAAGGAMEPTG